MRANNTSKEEKDLTALYEGIGDYPDHLASGAKTNPNSPYYEEPQELDNEPIEVKKIYETILAIKGKFPKIADAVEARGEDLMNKILDASGEVYPDSYDASDDYAEFSEWVRSLMKR